jgi:HEAT repeat protein
MGILLVGCSSFPSLSMNRRIDPIAALQSKAPGEDRIESYRRLGKIAEVPIEMRAMARKLLMDGAASEYNVLARSAAVASLGRYPEPDVVDVLLKATEDRSPIVRVEACHALHQRRDQSVIAALSGLATEDSDPDVRIAATGALVSIGDQSTTGPLMECLKDAEFAVAHRAADGLRKITGAPIATDKYQDWKSWADGNPTPRGVEATAQQVKKNPLMNLFR